MNIQKKRFVVYSLFIIFGLSIGFLFLRKKNPPPTDIVSETIVKKDSIITVSFLSESFNLESNGESFVSTEKALSGKHSCKLSKDIEFGISINKVLRDIPTFNNLKNISIKINAFLVDENPDALFVLSINDATGKNIFWDGKPIAFSKTNEWLESTFDFAIPAEFINPDNKIVAYPWNRNKKLFYVDDISIEYIGTAIYRERSENQSEKSNLFLDFETEAGLSNADNVKETTAHSGKKACDLSGGKEYGPSLNKKLSEFGSAFPKIINMSMWVYPLTDNPNTVLVASVINSKNETVFWEGKSTENKSFPKNTWTKINASFKLPIEKFNAEDVLGVSAWNKGKTDVIIDDVEIVYGESPERRGEESKVDPISIYEKRFVSEKNKPPFQTIWMEKQETGKELIAFSSDDLFIAANFDNDVNGIDELLCISKNKQALFTYDLKMHAFKRIWENKNPGDQLWGKDNFYTESIINSKTSIIIQQKNKPMASVLNFDGKNWNLVGEQKVIPPPSSPTNSISQYFGNFSSDKNQTLKLDRSWRFDLKLIENNIILGNVDFKGYPNDYNPKYYEFVKLVPGNFLSSKQTSLLVVMCNCADADFSGESCNQIEDLPFLPNSVQLYSIEKEKSFSQIDADKK